MSESKTISVWSAMMFPVVAVTLGWGLRGYIGGGPFGAMIPGAFIALSFSLIWKHDRAYAAVVACFGTIALGYGGEMTYGQTLGFLRESDTRAWGFLGVTIKGAVWGLLGGGVLGAGMVHRRLDRLRLLLALPIMVAAFFIGWKIINEPKLIYFSDPVNKPREESWAGLLASAVAFLIWIAAPGGRTLEPYGRVIRRFAVLGMVGGALGFGGGAIWLAYGPMLQVDQKWWGWWKMMEFTFGGVLGGFLGWAAWLERDALTEACRIDDTHDSQETAHDWRMTGAIALLVIAYFGAIPAVFAWSKESETAAWIARNAGSIFYTFVFFGGACLAMGLRSEQAAWHVAVTLTFFHTAYDLNEDLLGGRVWKFPAWAQWAATIGMTMVMAVVVELLRSGTNATRNLYLALLWSCMAVAFVRGGLVELAGSEGGLAARIAEHPSLAVTFGIFTVTAIATTVFIGKPIHHSSTPSGSA